MEESKQKLVIKRTGFKKIVLLIALGLLLFSFISITAGLFIPSVPLCVFYLGYAIIWISIPFWTGAWLGLAGFFSSIPCILVFFFLLSGMGIVLIPSIEKEYPIRTPRITEEDDQLDDM